MAPHTDPAARLIAECDGLVRVEENMFRIADVGPDPAGDNGPPDPPDEQHLLTTRDGTALLLSGLSDHFAALSLQCWSAEPPEPDPAPYPSWDAVTEADFRAPSGRLESSSGLLLEMGAHQLRIAPGRYTIRAWTAGATAANDREAAGEFMPRGAEIWTVRLWPAAS